MLFRSSKFLAAALVGGLIPLLSLRAQEPPPTKPAAPGDAAKTEAKAKSKAETPKTSTDPIDRIKEEGLKRSQVMATLSYLTDVIGPRLTGSPNLKRANEWTCQTLTKWGLANAHLEAWGPFGRGWTLKRFSAQVVEPQCIPADRLPQGLVPRDRGHAGRPGRLLRRQDRGRLRQVQGQAQGGDRADRPAAEVAARFEPLATRKTDKRAAQPGRRRRAHAVPARPDGPAAATEPHRGRTQGRPGDRGRAARRGERAAAAPAARAGPARRAAEPLRPRDAGPDGAGPQEGQVPGRRGRRAAGRLQLAGGGRHALRRPGERPGRLDVPHADRGQRGRPGGSPPGTRTPPRSCPRSSWPRSTTTAWSG